MQTDDEFGSDGGVDDNFLDTNTSQFSITWTGFHKEHATNAY